MAKLSSKLGGSQIIADGGAATEEVDSLRIENESLRAELMRQQKEAERAREQVYRLRFSSIACRLRSNKPPETGTRAYLHSCGCREGVCPVRS